MGIFLFSKWHPVYAFPMTCYSCRKIITVYFPEDVANYHFNIPTLKNLYSKTQQHQTIGNICPHCNAYQGNWFVYDEFISLQEKENDYLIMYPACVIELEPKCADCGKPVDYEVPIIEVCEYDYEFGDIEYPPEYYCRQCTMEREIYNIVRTLEESTVCNICEKNILPKEFKEELRKMCIDDLNKFVFTAIIPHHINYEKDIKINVCGKCHGKTHHSKDPAFDKYRPVDKREDFVKPKTTLVPCSNNCGGRTRVLIEGYNDSEEHLCYKCREKRERLIRKDKRWKQRPFYLKEKYLRDWELKHG